MISWPRLFPQIPVVPPLSPQIEAWADDSHLYDFVLDGVVGPDHARFPLTRHRAMRVPAVARARNLTCGTIAGLPLLAMRGDTQVAPQPYWMYGTDGQIGDLTPEQQRKWRISPQTPFHRMLWTVDDQLFYGDSLWIVTRFTDTESGGRRLPLRVAHMPHDQWTWDGGALVDTDNDPLPAERILYLPGPHEGILDFGRDTIRTAQELESNAADVARRPFRLELHQTSGAELTKPERSEVVREARAALAANDGILFTNQAIETKEHRLDAEALQVGARNASALDVARLANMPAAMLDASTQGASLEYQTLQGRNQQWLDYGLALFLDPIEARLSMDDVLPAGQRSAFDTADWTTDAPSATGPPRED